MPCLLEEGAERCPGAPTPSPAALPAPPCRPPPSWPCTCRERSSARPGAGRRCRDQSSPPAGGNDTVGGGHPHIAAGQPPGATPTSPHQLVGTGCGARAAPGITPGKGLSPRVPRPPLRWGRPTRRGVRNKRPLCPHGASHSSCAPSRGTRPQGAAGTAPAGASSVPASGLDHPLLAEPGGVLGSAAVSPPPWGPHLAEGRPLLLARLVEAVVVLAVRLEDAGSAQLVEGLQGDPRGIPEPHRAVLVPGGGGDTHGEAPLARDPDICPANKSRLCAGSHRARRGGMTMPRVTYSCLAIQPNETGAAHPKDQLDLPPPPHTLPDPRKGLRMCVPPPPPAHFGFPSPAPPPPATHPVRRSPLCVGSWARFFPPSMGQAWRNRGRDRAHPWGAGASVTPPPAHPGGLRDSPPRHPHHSPQRRAGGSAARQR